MAVGGFGDTFAVLLLYALLIAYLRVEVGVMLAFAFS
jgi:hypothetical protein